MSLRGTLGIGRQSNRLREILPTRQSEESQLRWFNSPVADLYVWEHKAGGIQAFEFCYNKPQDEHALRWADGQGLWHTGIDDGEASPWRNETPIAVADGAFDPESIALEFERVGAMVPPAIYRFVLSILHSRP